MANVINQANANRLNPTTAALVSALGWRNGIGNLADAGANMWKASQNGLANIFQTGIQADVQRALGEQALKNQAQLYANSLSLGNNQLSTLSQLGNAGYQNQIDRINALMKGLNPLLSGIGSGQAFSGLGTGIANMAGGYGGRLGGGGLLRFQSSDRAAAALPAVGGLGSYGTGIGMAPQRSLNTPNAQMMPDVRQTMTARGANGGWPQQAFGQPSNYQQPNVNPMAAYNRQFVPPNQLAEYDAVHGTRAMA